MTDREAFEFYRWILSLGIANHYAEAAKISISAIQEREERAKGCKVCNNQEFYLENLKKVILNHYGFEMICCPVCGRPLKEV